MSTSIDTPLEILGGISAEVFLRDYWQKKPLLIRQAIPNFVSPLDGNDLAGLSLEELAESRIVLEHGETPWQLRQGPFTEDTYSSLPERDWTLLVQAADQFSPDVAEVLEHTITTMYFYCRPKVSANGKLAKCAALKAYCWNTLTCAF